MRLSERQIYMLKDFARFNFNKYPYHAMPAEELEIRDWRTISSLLRNNLVEYPNTINHLGLPDMNHDCIRITQKGIDLLNQIKGK